MSEKQKELPSSTQKDLDKAQKDFDQFKESVDNLTFDRMNAAPKEETEPQTRLSSRELSKTKPLFLKPKRQIGSKEKFNENFREDFNFASERVNFIAENNEVIGETINAWTKPFPGMSAEEWEIPTNKAVCGPRYLAEQLKRCTYHRLVMEDRPVEQGVVGTIYGSMVADITKQRLDAHPVSEKKSVFMGASGF
jgi:hypothetical protein